jgi:hypothetical protein
MVSIKLKIGLKYLKYLKYSIILYIIDIYLYYY